MNEESSLARNRAAFAISSGRPRRPIGVFCTAQSSIGCASFNGAISGVSIHPGQIAFTRTLCGAPSSPNCLVSPSTPCFAAM